MPPSPPRAARVALGAATTAEAVALWAAAGGDDAPDLRRPDAAVERGPRRGEGRGDDGRHPGSEAGPGHDGDDGDDDGDSGDGGAVVPEHESAVRRLAADVAGSPYRALRTLAEARAADDGVVVLEGDLGAQVFATAPARLVRCDEASLRRLADDLAARRPGDGGGQVYFERHPAGARLAGGAGGGVVLPRPWVHDELVQAGLEAPIRAVLAGRRDRLGPA